MNKTELEGNWDVLKGKLKQKYATLTDDDLLFAKGKKDEVMGKLQKKLGQTNPVSKINLVVQKKDSLAINFIEEGPLKNYTRAYVIGKLGFKSSSKISYDDLKDGINKLDATQNFSAISYQIKKVDKGENLILQLTENPNNVPEGASVIVTFVKSNGVDIDLESQGIDTEQAQSLRASLATFSEDWDSPEMSIYDNYEAAKANC